MYRPELSGWRMQYDRMMRTLDRVNAGNPDPYLHEDDVQHFWQDCWHLKDWIKNDATVKKASRKAWETLVLSRKSLKIVADLANASKHMVLDSRKKVGAYAAGKDVTVYLGQKRRATITFRIGLDDGTTVISSDLIRDAISDWNDILKGMGLNP